MSKKHFIISDTIQCPEHIKAHRITVGAHHCGEVFLDIPRLPSLDSGNHIIVIYQYQGHPSDNIVSLMQLDSRLSVISSKVYEEEGEEEDEDGMVIEESFTNIDLYITYMPYLRGYNNFLESISNTPFRFGAIDPHRKLRILQSHHANGFYVLHMNQLISPEDHLNMCFAFPDAGSISRVEEKGLLTSWAKFIDKRDEHFPMIQFDKKRDEHGEIASMFMEKCDLEGKICILSDDIIDSGQTLLSASAMLKEAGVSKVYAYVTHAVFGHDNLTRSHVLDAINKDDSLDKLFITNTIYYPAGTFDNCPKIEVLDIMQDVVNKLFA